MPAKNYYALLEIEPTASADDVKRAFRLQIARYHPDKVQHLGKEFQDMAAGRAAELTEAYRILSDRARRAEYDRLRSTSTAAASPTPAGQDERTARQQPSEPAPEAPPNAGGAKAGGRFTQERASRDELVRKATIDRFKQALVATFKNGYDSAELRGFDIACVPKSSLFGRTKGPRLLGRFVSCVDGDAVSDAWAQAGKWAVPSNEEICVFLMGSAIASPRELADSIAKQRRQPRRGGIVTLIPVDVRSWDAHVPTDAPAVAKSLLARLRSGN